jgi:hypothetical protein
MPKSKLRKQKKKKITSKRQHREIYSPTYDINTSLLSKISYELWPKEVFNTIEGIEDCKNYYNNSYKRLSTEIDKLIDKYHPAAWARIAYIQLEAWTLLCFKKQMPDFAINIIGPNEFIAVGRYSWRYILEISLEKIETTNIISSERPSKEDEENMFSLLTALAQCAEYSNYLHFMPNIFSSVKIELKPYLFLKHPILNKENEEKFHDILKALDSRPNLGLYPDFSPEQNMVLMSMINDFLKSNFGFSLDEVTLFTTKILAKILNKIGASIIVNSYNELVYLCSEISNFEKEKIEKLLAFISLDIKDGHYENRNFLIKSQQRRMVNYCGAIVYLNKNLETVYSYEAARFPYVRNCVKHIILAPMLIAEWQNNFVDRLIYGQRSDLKAITKKFNIEISAIEEYFHRQIFEKGVIKLLEKRGFKCLTVKKINGRDLECGEIDILGYLKATNTLLIVESKNLSPARDAKAAAQVIRDHFDQKKYHKKFIKKISWVKNNLNDVIKLFNVDSAEINIRGSFFITARSSVIKYMVTEYDVLSFSEFDNFLKNEYDT